MSAASSAHADAIVVLIALFSSLLRRSVCDPLADRVDSRLRQVRAPVRHAVAQRLGAFELVDDEAVAGIPGDDADQVGIARAGDVDEVAVGESRVEPQPLLRGGAAVAARDRAVDGEDVRLYGGEGRLQPRYGR